MMCSFSPLTRGIFLCFLHPLMHAKWCFVVRIKELSFLITSIWRKGLQIQWGCSWKSAISSDLPAIPLNFHLSHFDRWCWWKVEFSCTMFDPFVIHSLTFLLIFPTMPLFWVFTENYFCNGISFSHCWCL